MALMKCRECGNEVSTDAKACPQCGAVRRRGIPRWVVVAAVLGAIAYFYYEGFLNPTLPESCDSFRAEKTFRDLFEKSAYAQENRLRVLEVIDRKQVGSGPNPEDLVCEMTYSLTDTTTATYLYSFRRKQDGPGYIVRQQPK